MAGPGTGPGRGRSERRPSGGSLRRTLVTAALVTTLPLLGLVGLLAWRQVSEARGRVARDALAHASLLAAEVERHLGARVEAVTGAATLLGAGPVTAGSVEGQWRRLRQAFGDIERVLVVDGLGGGVAAVPAGPEGRRVSVADRDWFQRAAISTEAFVGAPWQGGRDVLVGVYAPIRGPDGQLHGVLAVDITLRRVQEALTRASLPSGAVAALVTDRGVVVARQPPVYLMGRASEFPEYAELLARGGTGQVVFEDGERRLAGVARVRPVGWALAVGMPPGDVLRETWTFARLIAAAAVAVTVGGLALALRLSARQAESFGRLRQAMIRLQSGDLPAGLPVTVGGEAGALTEQFNRMLTWLRGTLREYEVVSQVEEAASQLVAGDRSVDSVLPSLLRRVVGGVGADVGVLALADEGGLVPRAAVGFFGSAVEGGPARRGHGLLGAAAHERATVVVADVATDYRVEEPYLKDGGIRSAVALPMTSGEELVGVVLVGYRSPQAFPAEELQRLEAIVRRTARAVERARAIDAVQRSTQGLEARLAEQMAALQQAAAERAEARQQAQEARRQAQEIERRMRLQAAQAAQVTEVVVEREVVRADPAAEEMARLRAEMQRTVSEELRAPLTALLDLPRLLVEGLQRPLGDAERGQLEILQERGQEILELIEGLAVLTGLQAGRVKITRAPTDLPALVQRVVRLLQPRAAAKGNRIETDIKPGVGQVPVDARRLEQVLTNLILFAVKYTEVGEIRITCYQRDREAVIVVADDGVGFTAEEQARIFEPFLQVGPRGGRSLPGTGLLLTVADRLVAALGGTIRIESEPDRGTWVTVTVPTPAGALAGGVR